MILGQSRHPRPAIDRLRPNSVLSGPEWLRHRARPPAPALSLS